MGKDKISIPRLMEILGNILSAKEGVEVKFTVRLKTEEEKKTA